MPLEPLSSSNRSTPLLSTIVDNEGENTLEAALGNIAEGGHELWVATAFFSLDALNMIGEKLEVCERVCLLFGDNAAHSQRRALLRAMRARSDAELGSERQKDPLLSGLKYAKKMIDEGRLVARCYKGKGFHAKAYLAFRPGHPPVAGILGSGNFTRSGLTMNVELNAKLTEDQTQQLKDWYAKKWDEAAADDVTDDLKAEISRQLDLYDPYAIYQKALIAWGRHYQGDLSTPQRLSVLETLDPHQELGFRRALEILKREHGVMICDGVGLGKSFIALALMEHFCRQKKNVLLISPKSILESSWYGYLSQYLDDYQYEFGSIVAASMTDLGFEPSDGVESENDLTSKQKKLIKWAERVDVVVIDESHNFRTTNTQRYINLRRILRPLMEGLQQRKKVVLLTATPINTHYEDLSAQLALITQEVGHISGYDTKKIVASARLADKEARKEAEDQQILDFDAIQDRRGDVLPKVLEAVVIQRKRTTCIELAEAIGKTLMFPVREAPTALTYDLSDSWKEVVSLAHKRFKPTAAFLKVLKAEYKKAETAGVEIKPPKMPSKGDAIKFAAFLPEQYRIAGKVGKRNYQTEVLLAGLVFTNTMKQLESSPAAFQGILQSLGTSLIARLRYVFKDKAEDDIADHVDWVNTPINQLVFEDEDADVEEGENTELNGEELDEWLERAISSRHLHKKLADFTDAEFNVEKWRKDILGDLAYIKEIHRETLAARRLTDFKLAAVEKELKGRMGRGERVVVFTQSQRTSFYLEKALTDAFPERKVARIDSNVIQTTRADILYAFCPNYNPKPEKQHRERVDILICTDVLSEGVNMQEAGCILNYDIHWNPVRLIQRIGRVDRRLDPAKNPVPHSFSIINCFPPNEINDIIELVDTVENRTTQISRTLGIDQAFFKASDPAGTLKEFNKVVDGEPSLTDRANERYVATLANPDPEILAAVEQMPPGAFGVWDNAPVNGLFALFTMEGSDGLSEADTVHFASILGQPMLAVEVDGSIGLDAVSTLDLLSNTVKGSPSGNPSDATALGERLRRLKNKVNQSFTQVNLVAGIQPRLVCWLELRKGS